MAMKPPEARPSSPVTSAMVDAWSDGKVTEPSHEQIAQGGYRSGLHDGMRYVVDMMEDGHDLTHILDRCRARVTGLIDKPLEEHSMYWLAKVGHNGQGPSDIDHGANYAKQSLD